MTSYCTSHQQAAVDFVSWNRYADRTFVFHDDTLINHCRNGNQVCSSAFGALSPVTFMTFPHTHLPQHCEEFFRLLSLCHTVIPKEDKGMGRRRTKVWGGGGQRYGEED